MNISDFDSRSASNEGHSMHLRHPVTGEKLFNDTDEKEPCLVLIKGAESPEVQKVLYEINKGQLKADGDETDDRPIEDVQQQLIKTATPLVVGFKHIEREDNGEMRALNPVKADIAWFLNLQFLSLSEDKSPSFLQQVIAFSNDRANFLKAVSIN